MKNDEVRCKARESKFILLGKIRIKLGNIKNYGISSEMKEYEKIYKRIDKPRKFLAFHYTLHEFVWEGDIIKLTSNRRSALANSSIRKRTGTESYKYAYKRYRDEKGEIVKADFSTATLEDSVVEKEINYLYITTYQRDNFIFYEDEVDFDIFDKCRELDEKLCF